MASPVERIAARLIRLENRVAGLATGPQLAYSAIEDGALEEYDKFDQLVTIIGKQPDGTHGAVSVSGPTPPRPSVAVVSGGPGLLNYGWDGNFAGSDGKADITIPAPMDFARVEAHASKMQGFTADTAATLLDTLESPRGGSRTAMVEPGTWYVVLVARSHSGKRSAQSVEVAIEVLPPIGSDIDVEALREEFRAVDEQMNKDLLANQGELTAAQKRIDSLTSKVTPLESALQTLEQSTLPGIQTQINTKNKTINSTTNAAGSTGYTSGDTWQKWSSLDDSGRLLAAWRFTVNKTWSPVLLDPTYLPQVDIGAGTFGSLEGGRLSSGSVTTRELVVGSFTNLVENPAWEYGTKSWTSWSNGWSVETSGGRRTAPVLRFTGSTTRTLGPQSSNMPLDLAGEQVGDNTGAKFRVSGWVRTTSAGSTRGELCLYTYAANGTTFLTNRNFNIDGATSEWKYFSTIMEAPRANAAYVRLRLNATLSTASDEYFFDDLSVVNAVEGNVIVDGTIKGIHVDAESVAAKVGAFVEADIGKLRVTGSTNLNTLVAQRIAANVGSYLKLYANQVFVGHPGNMMPDPGFNDAGMTALRNQHSTIAVDLSADNDLRLNNTSTGLQYLRPYGTPQTQAGVLGGGWIAVEPGQVWTLKFKVSAWKGTTGWAQFVGRTADGSAYANPYPSGGPKSRANITSSSQDVEVEATIPENCYWIIPEVAVAPGGFSYIKRNTMVLTQKITPALIVDGFFQGLRVIGASIETNAASQRGIKLIDSGLHAWDSQGNLTFRLDTADGGVFARGNFESSAGGVTARLGSLLYTQGYTRPALVFETSSGGSQPKVFAEGPGDAVGSFGEGSLVAMGREAVVNSSGRANLVLQPDGAGGFAETSYGPYSGTGFRWEGSKASVRGQLSGFNARDQLRHGRGGGGTAPSGNFVEWTFTHPAPPPSGVIQPVVTTDQNNAAGAHLPSSVNSISRTGFKVRVHNSHATPFFVDAIYWIGVWVA